MRNNSETLEVKTEWLPPVVKTPRVVLPRGKNSKISPVNFLLPKIRYPLQTDSTPYNLILKM